MTTTEQCTTDLFHNEKSPAVSYLSSNVGSITDFILTSEHSSLNNDEQVLENSKLDDILVSLFLKIISIIFRFLFFNI